MLTEVSDLDALGNVAALLDNSIVLSR